MRRAYSRTVLEHFYSPHNGFPMQDPSVIGRAGKPGKGAYMALYLKVDGNRIEGASFQTYGCAPAIAAGSLVAQKVELLTREEAGAWVDEGRIEAALDGLPKHKRHCAKLAATALQDALLGWDSLASRKPNSEN